MEMVKFKILESQQKPVHLQVIQEHTSILPTGDSLMYIETSGNNNELNNKDTFVSFERTDNIHISNITFYYNRFSIVNDDKSHDPWVD